MNVKSGRGWSTERPGDDGAETGILVEEEGYRCSGKGDYKGEEYKE